MAGILGHKTAVKGCRRLDSPFAMYMETIMHRDMNKVKETFENLIPFHRFLGIRVAELREGFARIVLPYREEFIGDVRRPAIHGGVISTLIDLCGGAAVWTHFRADDMISTIDIRVDYLRPGPAEDLIVEAEIMRVGNRVAVVNSRAFSASDPGNILAEGRGAYNIRRAGAE